ncbi:LacI family DNA-binding transcriptional regulator [uncultured Planktomarina sp.]
MILKQRNKADIVDVARRAGVSISTVSRSFNHPRFSESCDSQKD